MGKEFQFVVPGDVNNLSANRARMNKHKRHRLVKEWQQKAWLAWSAAGAVSFKGKVHLSFLIRRGRLMDVENVMPALKALVDGVKGHGWLLVDDSPNYVEWGGVGFITGKEFALRPEVRVIVQEVK